MASVAGPGAARRLPQVAALEIALSCAVGGAVAAVVSYSSGRTESVDASLVALFGSFLALLALRDLVTRRIPNAIVYPAIILGIFLTPAWSDRGVVARVEGAGAALTVVSLISALSRGALGGGDVKMAVLVGVVVGFPKVMVAGAVTAIGGGLVGVALLTTGLSSRSGRFAYGPFIALGAAAALLL